MNMLSANVNPTGQIGPLASPASTPIQNAPNPGAANPSPPAVLWQLSCLRVQPLAQTVGYLMSCHTTRAFIPQTANASMGALMCTLSAHHELVDTHRAPLLYFTGHLSSIHPRCPVAG